MRLNPNHEKDGEEAWKKHKLSYGQKVKFEGEEVTVIAIGYGMLLDGRVQIDTGEGLKTVDVTQLER
jgi:hypothetical protein